MADDVKDIAIYTGSEWTSLSELTAGVVDAKLPIESVDGTVVVDGASSVFTVSTGGTERVKVDGSGHVAVNRTPRANTQFEVTSDADSPFTLILDGTASTQYEGRSGLRMYGTSTFISEFYTNAEEGTYGFSGGFTSRSGILTGDLYADILVKPGQAVVMQYSIQTPSVRGLADNDAEVKLGANFSVSAGGSIRQQVLSNGQVQIVSAGTIDLPALCFGYTNTGLSFASGSDGKNDSPESGLAFSAPNTRVSNVVNEIIRFRRDGQVVVGSEYVPQTDNSLVTKGWVSANAGGGKLPIESVDGTVVVDGASSVFKVSTGGEQRVEVSDRFPLRVLNKNGSLYDASGTNTAGVQVTHNVTGTGITRCSAYEGVLNFSGTVSDLAVFSARNVNFIGSGDVVNVYAGFKVANLANKGAIQAGYVSEVSDGDGRYQFYGSGNAPSYFGGQIQSPSVRGLADNDASVTLDGKATVSAAPRLCETVWDSANNEISELFASKNIKCYAPNGRVNYVRPNDTQTGYFYWYDVNLEPDQKSIASVGAGGFTLSATETLGFTGDGINFAANSKGDQATVLWAMKQDGGLIGGGENSYIQTPSVRGLVDNDASITLGDQATLKAGDGSEYVPTDSASIATKKIVDDKIWVGSTAQYLAIPPRDILPTTLYCLTD